MSGVTVMNTKISMLAGGHYKHDNCADY